MKMKIQNNKKIFSLLTLHIEIFQSNFKYLFTNTWKEHIDTLLWLNIINICIVRGYSYKKISFIISNTEGDGLVLVLSKFVNRKEYDLTI